MVVGSCCGGRTQRRKCEVDERSTIPGPECDRDNKRASRREKREERKSRWWRRGDDNGEGERERERGKGKWVWVG